MSDFNESSRPPRRPGAYDLSPPAVKEAQHRKPQSFDKGFDILPDEADPFTAEDLATLDAPPLAVPRSKGFSFGKLALGALGVLVSFAFGLWADQLVRDLFARADWLGYTALGALFIALFAILMVVIREVVGLLRINAVQDLKADTDKALIDKSKPHAKSIVSKLTAIVSHRAETAQGRAKLEDYKDDVIDGPQLLEIAEKELLTPLDRQARLLILNASKRVSVVTAISPRALVDIAYVLFETSRLVRSMAELYGGRPGTLGMFKLMRDVIAHLAVTGSIAVGDGLMQQVLGHGLATKLSARLGEGVINGLLTARIGIAAMDLCRPMPFTTIRRPSISDFISDLTPSINGK
jgi:putative membrane protein